MQLFAGLMLNRVGIALQPIHVALEPVILKLQILHLPIELLRLLPLLLIYGQSIRPEDDVIRNSECKRRGTHGRSLSSPNRKRLQGRAERGETSSFSGDSGLDFHLSS